jgi:hypothetical protein
VRAKMPCEHDSQKVRRVGESTSSQLLPLNYGATLLTEDLLKLTALSERAYEDSDATVKGSASALKKKPLQMVDDLIIYMSSIISWKVASNFDTTCGLSQHQTRRCKRTCR